MNSQDEFHAPARASSSSQMRVSPIDSKVITSYSPSRALSVSSAFKTALCSTEHGVLSLISAAFAGIAAVNAIAAAAIVAMVLVGMAIIGFAGPKPRSWAKANTSSFAAASNRL
jgi:hypothetical protein